MIDATQGSRFLILDGDIPASLSVARSLTVANGIVFVGSHESNPVAGYSRNIASSVQYPPPLTQPDAFVDWCVARLSTNVDDLIVPVTERTLKPLHQARDRLDESRIAMPPYSALEIALDKSRTLKLAKDLGIPVPQTREVRSRDDIEDALSGLLLPVVVKPVSSMGFASGRQMQLAVSYALSLEQARAAVTDGLRHGAAVLLQEYVRGEGGGIELIADQGQIVYAFQHRRIHELPLTGGGSSLRRSEPIDPELLAASARLMEALGWHGVAMVEFKQNRQTGDVWLMEINGRFWGSLPLSVAAGADFPVMLSELLLDGQVTPRPPARVGVVCRNLTRDVQWHEAVLRRDAPKELVQLPTARQVWRDLALILKPDHHFDVQDWRDPVPGLVESGRLIKSYAGRLGSLISDGLERRRQRAAWRSGRLAARLKKARHLLFVCHGNINRSAVAHRYAEKILGPAVVCASAGFHDEEGRPADPVMVELAAAQGIDLRHWSSCRLDAAMIEQADVIMVMELGHYWRIVQTFPKSCSKVFLLGISAPQSNGDIPDPYGNKPSLYESSLRQVIAGVDQLRDFLEWAR